MKKAIKLIVAAVVVLTVSAGIIVAQTKAPVAKAKVQTEKVAKQTQTATVKKAANVATKKAVSVAPAAQYTVIDFNATWCGPCKVFAPVFESVGKKYASKATFKSIDIDQNPQMATKYGVEAIPCIVVLKGERVVAKQVGSMSESEFDAFIKGAIK